MGINRIIIKIRSRKVKRIRVKIYARYIREIE